MKKIAIVGYHATGSGVIEDLLREMDNTAFGEYNAELRILHDPDCISDLEYHIVTDPHRLGTGLAIKRFLAYCKNQSRMEEKLFGKEWMNICTTYAESLACHKYKGWIDNDIQFIPEYKKRMVWFQKAFFYLLRKEPICKIIPKSWHRPRWYDYYPKLDTYYANISEEEFICKTKCFVENLCSRINNEGKEFVVLNQFVCAHNPMRDLRYVDDMKVIIVDRDPRDSYVHHALHRDHVLPKNPIDFCRQYRLMRNQCGVENSNKIMHVKYEDMIFKYDEMVPKVLDFLEINQNHHVAKKKYFKPGVSINGTQLWIYKSSKYAKEVEMIEKELPDMIYNYPNESKRNKITSEIDETEALKEYATKH